MNRPCVGTLYMGQQIAQVIELRKPVATFVVETSPIVCNRNGFLSRGCTSGCIMWD